MKRSRSGSKWRRRGYTHEVTSLKPWGIRQSFKVILVLRPYSVGYWRKHPSFDDDIVRPVGTYYIHNGRKPRK
jgi:hypothetical protein